jgi:hypothetical protein
VDALEKAPPWRRGFLVATCVFTPRASIMLNDDFGFGAENCTSCGGVCGLHMSPWKPSWLDFVIGPHDRRRRPREPPGRRHGGKGSAVLEPPLFDRNRTIRRAK